jgi:hypothetical protein
MSGRPQVRAGGSLSSAGAFVLPVKRRINGRIRRNCNGLLILKTYPVLIAAGFARSLFAVRQPILQFGF